MRWGHSLQPHPSERNILPLPRIHLSIGASPRLTPIGTGATDLMWLPSIKKCDTKSHDDLRRIIAWLSCCHVGLSFEPLELRSPFLSCGPPPTIRRMVGGIAAFIARFVKSYTPMGRRWSVLSTQSRGNILSRLTHRPCPLTCHSIAFVDQEAACEIVMLYVST